MYSIFTLEIYKACKHIQHSEILSRNIGELCLASHSPKFILLHRSKSKQIELGYQSWALKFPS